ncbi:unnamed protein product [Pseudo-nitzschia multistriata]|uniref:Pseudouridine-5'-phosphate glycosidase n=1 Tax=Pseudo-nitzschia multistriata TaxID=183589 RepID=A0A448ZKH7_9STRA|nr:unnamed protein product [Pseudo-nitzschia multistriata]
MITNTSRLAVLPHRIEAMAGYGVRRCRRQLHRGRHAGSAAAFLDAGSRVVGSARRWSSSRGGMLSVQDKVESALSEGRPVCALESTIVAHGMPYPENLELAREVEGILEDRGVVPATIAVRNGVCRIGISGEELEDLARAGGEGRAQKCSTRDLPLVLGMAAAAADPPTEPQWGATTVASTMRLAHLAGIETFVTGGIGGVHRGGEDSMDVSSDLTELGQTPVVVVSAGIKSILDIGRTLEVLETNSVPALGWQTDEFPAFFSPASGIPCPARADAPEEVAHAYWAARRLELPQGMLVGVPNHDPAGESVERAIKGALESAETLGVRGRDVTPFVLKTVADTTGGDSLRSNMALVRQNARVGAEIATAIAKLRNEAL